MRIFMERTKTQEEINQENEKLATALGKTSLDAATLQRLRGRMDKKVEEDVPKVVAKRSVAIEMAVIGVGQAGSRIAEVFHKLGYDAGVINTSSQDLEYIDVVPSNKLLLTGTLGGTGKDLDLGREIFSSNLELITDFSKGIVEGNNMVYLAVSGGGGTGSSSVEVMVPMLYEFGTPVGVIYVLPKATEDAQSKKNSLETLARLAKLSSANVIASLVVVDNARIEAIYANLSQSKFWEASNRAIVEPIDVFNHLTSRPSRFTSLDPSDFGKIVSAGDCSVYGVIEVEDYMSETALAESVIDSLSSNMLAEGFDLTQTRVGGVIITGSKEVLDRLPAININYCFHMISEQTKGASIFQGIYDVDSDTDSVKIYSWFAGLGLPKSRIETLKEESKAQSAVASQKDKDRSSSMSMSLEDEGVGNIASDIHKKIQRKNSGFNRLQVTGTAQNSLIDMRRKR
jgi:cell division GTPase FtsZ